jgi:hypothetical protein
VSFFRSIYIWLRNGIDCIATTGSVLLSCPIISSISRSMVGDCCCARAPPCIPSLCCRSSYISWTFRAFSSGRTSICSAPSTAIILDSTASFSLLNIRVLGLSATAPVFSIACLRYSIGSPCINHYPFSCSVRFPAATVLAKMVVKSCT